MMMRISLYQSATPYFYAQLYKVLRMLPNEYLCLVASSICLVISQIAQQFRYTVSYLFLIARCSMIDIFENLGDAMYWIILSGSLGPLLGGCKGRYLFSSVIVTFFAVASSLFSSFIFQLMRFIINKLIMAKLQKGFEDYFRIPILLKPVGQTPLKSMKKVYQMLTSQKFQITIDERYQPLPTQSSKLLQKREKNVPQTFHFRLSEFSNQWSEFQVIYRCRFCVGVFDSSQGDLSEEWKKINKLCSEENRKIVGLIILSLENCNIQDVKAPYIIIPQKIGKQQIFPFLEPWLFTILPIIQDYLCYLISQLQKDDNGFIVFNKAEEKPEPRTLKKKKKGRCLKLCGDFCLVLHLVKHAYNFYIEAEEICKKVDDYLWALGCSQGKLTCFTADFEPQGKNKQQVLQQTRNQCFLLAKKIKIPQLETENYFKILKIYTKIHQSFDEMAREFLIYILTNYSSSQKFSVLTQLAFLYKQAGMMRKHNYILYLASRISMELKPSLVGVILTQILQSGHIKQWPLINANVIKLLIDNGIDALEGKLYLDLLQSCWSVLSEKDIQVTIQALQHRNFALQSINKSTIFDIMSINCVESNIKPKLNKLGDSSTLKQPTQGFFMNWRKKQTIYQFQQNQVVSFQIKIRNTMSFPIRCSLRLHFETQVNCQLHSFYLNPKVNKLTLTQKFADICAMNSLKSIEVKIFNFVYLTKACDLPSLKMQIYEEYPDFQIQIPQAFKNQQSSLFQFPLTLKRTKPYLSLAKIKITISIYYSLEVGFQQTQYFVQSLLQEKYLIVSNDYPYDKSQDQTVELIKLQPFKLHKKYLKKIECKVDAIRQEGSKYQVSKIANSSCHFQRSIWCELMSVSTPMQSIFKVNDQNIIEQKFIIKITINKKQDDLTPYKITEGNQSYILSDKTTVVMQKVLSKIPRTKENEQKNLQIYFQWRNLTRQKEHGNIVFDIPMEQKMFVSRKKIQFTVENWNKREFQQIKCPTDLRINYIAKSSEQNLSHQVIIKPLNLSEVKKYVMIGKTKLKAKSENEIANNFTIKLFYEYKEQYLLGLKFDDSSIYWFPCKFSITN